MSEQEIDNVMKIRLDTTNLLNGIRCTLEGKTSKNKVSQVDGQYIVEEIWEKTGTPLMNAEGVQSIMAKVSSILNPSIVQGNIDKFDDLRDFKAFLRRDLNDSLMLNLYKWEIHEYNYSFIMDLIVDQISLFLSRLVNNKERDSYTHTLKSEQVQKMIGVEKPAQGFSMPMFK